LDKGDPREAAFADVLMTRFAGAASGMLKMLAELEADALGDRLERVQLDRPTFIAGLARAGTTVMLELFARMPEVGTHRYRDFPFVFVPYWWNRYQDRLARREAPVERPHRDRILITKDSPEAFENRSGRTFSLSCTARTPCTG